MHITHSKLNEEVIKKQSFSTLFESFSLSAMGMVTAYRKVANEPAIPKMEVKME